MVSAPFLECSIIPSARALAQEYSYPKGEGQRPWRVNFALTAFSEVALGSNEDALLGNALASAASAGGYDTGVVRGRPGSWCRPRRTGEPKNGGRRQEGGKPRPP